MAVVATFRIPFDASRRRPRTASRAVLAAAAIALALAGCGRTPDAGVTTTAGAPDETTAATTVAPPTTTTTVSEPVGEPGVPPKPQGEPTIEMSRFFQVGDIVSAPAGEDTDSVVSNGTTFAEVSGVDSYRVDYHTEMHTEDGSLESTTTIVISGSNFFVEYSDGDGNAGAMLSTPQGMWIREADEWRPMEEGYEAFAFHALFLPDNYQASFAGGFDTLTFLDWDLIDNAWHAHHEAGEVFLAIIAGGETTDEASGDVWLSPDGFMHSYEWVSVYPQEDVEVRTSWRLSDLGTATIDLPDELSREASVGAAEAVQTHLLANAWTSETILGGEAFVWSSRTASATIDTDPQDSSDVAETKEVLNSWGAVGNAVSRR